ncbi:phosphoenolpyruvate--protein phosphotransferase [Parvularcula sp. LCG005]|uniref:phosphoenolpyruvate--protein phosphotransferase n=1 Tax=Parvularcula sp. LCG005 TaxID=3078805 RepID=UPI002942C25F|nr:phosphoenolpyruvate--protein phosphotransferase [Parvularcula sp. LCG005]WOI54144.1 phosphoenolpyruvate--protein phosphotransferase [Parvularcula sp. LCG005]
MPPTSDTGYEPRMRSTPRSLLKRIREVMAEETAPQARLDKLVSSIAANMVADVCSIYVRRSDDVLELFATEGLNRSAVHNTRMGINEGLVGWVATHRRSIKLRDAKTHEAFSYREETGEDPYNAFLGVPIIRSGQVLGVLVVQNAAFRDFSEEEVDVAQTVATILAEIVSTGELLEERDRQDVEALLHKPDHAMGTPIVAGIALGIVVRRDPVIRAHPTFGSNVAEEKSRLEEAVASVRKSVDDMVASDKAQIGPSKEVLEVFRLFAYDKGWVRRLEEKVLSGLSAETAVEQVQKENRARMRQVTDPYLRERFHDLDDLSRRLMRALSGETADAQLPEGAVLLADSLGPAELLELDSSKLRGLVLAEAATTSHAAIVARSMGVPMVAGVQDLVDKAAPGDTIVLDGGTGEVHLRPSADVLESFDARAQLRSQALARFNAEKDAPSITADGVPVELQMNAGLLLDMAQLKNTGAKSVGLFRTELQFLLGRGLPTAAAQEALYSQVLDAAEGRPVIFRTADIGSDKRAGYMDIPQEANPAMGWRGLRMTMDREGLMRTQIRALLSAASGRDLHFMLPLVTTASEIELAKGIIQKEVARHQKRAPLPTNISMGAMIEIPSAAWDAKNIAAACDFVSIGGNDLAQFFFAADRETELVSSRYDPLLPSFLSFLRETIRSVKSVGVPIGYCGEQAADPYMAMCLIAFGVDRLSVSAGGVGPLKGMIRSLDVGKFGEFLDPLLEQGGASLRPALVDYARKAGLDLA